MSRTEQLIEQQIAFHESQLKHIDELLQQAKQGQPTEETPDPLLATLEAERNVLARLLHEMRDEPPEDWHEAADKNFGPMGVWQIMARLIERAIERGEKRA